jgi:WhiB family redox-sensing transcriptional regulator
MVKQMAIELTELITWRDMAACRDTPEVDFFPSPEDVQGIAQAKEVCAGCPVLEECLSYAIETRQTEGVWGGHTTKERTKLRRKWAEEIRRAS